MKVSEIHIKNFKRFKNTKITGLSQQSKLVIIVGPNGCGKSSLFDAFHSWYKLNTGFGCSDETYYRKEKTEEFDWQQNVKVTFYNSAQIGTQNKKCMYFRTAHRNDPDFNVNTFSRIGVPYEDIRFQRLIDNDQAVSQNYQRLIYNTLSGVYSEANDGKYVKDLREELIGKVRISMANVFEDLLLNSIGDDPLGDGAFHFEKGSSKSFHYKNLSGGEKSAFDLLLDLITKLQYYDDTVFLIDEPELHMHTRLQGKLIKELYDLIPNNSQLWLTAHSFGVMRAASDLEKQNPGEIAILDFEGYDFDEECNISPVKIDRVLWEKFLSIALDDYSARIAPEVIILCEGSLKGSRRQNFDADIYNAIFGNEFPSISFISGGSCTDLEKDDHVGYSLLGKALPSSRILRLLDRDDRSEQQVIEFKESGFLMLERRHIESYLFDDEIIKKLVKSKGPNDHILLKRDVLSKIPEIAHRLESFFVNSDKDNIRFRLDAKERISNTIDDENQRKELLTLWDQSLEARIAQALLIKKQAIQDSKETGNPEDDIKSASGRIYTGLKELLSLSQCGNNTDSFMRDTLAPLITTSTQLYKQLKKEIIQPHI